MCLQGKLILFIYCCITGILNDIWIVHESVENALQPQIKYQGFWQIYLVFLMMCLFDSLLSSMLFIFIFLPS